MEYKKSIIILILIIFSVSIAGVSASDVNDTIVGSEDTVQMELSSNNEMAENNLQTIEENTAFTQANDDESVGDEIDSQTLSETEGTYYDLRDEIGKGGNKSLTKSYYRYTGGKTIEINTSGVINGNGAIIDMFGSNIQAFNVIASDVTFKNLTIKNANSTEDGGAIFFTGSGSVTDCNFVNNTARSWGGAIIFIGTGNVTNCNFTGNNARMGSAIYFYKFNSIDTLTVSNSIFLNNRANAEALDVVKNDNNIAITFKGHNNLFNAICSRHDEEVSFTNVTYWGKNGITTSSGPMSRSNKEAGQNITVKGVVNGNIINETIVTDENGEIVLGESGDYWIIVSHKADSYYTEVAETLFTNMKLYANVTSVTSNNKTVNITAKSNIDPEIMQGKLLFILPNGDEINATYSTGGIWWAVHAFDDYGDYQVNASYIGLDNVTVQNAIISINKTNSTVNVSDVVLNYGESKNVTVTAEGATGITAKIDNNPVTVINNYTIPISGLDAGTYTLTVTTIPDADHNEVTVTANITVNKANPEIRMNVTLVGDAAIIDVTVPADATGNITVTIDGKPYYANVSGSKAVLVIPGLTAGNKTVEVTYNGDYKYLPKSNSANLTISLADVGMMIVIAQNVTYGENETITAYVNAEGNVTFKINNQTYDTVNITDGKAVFSVPLNAGNYTVEAIYNGNSRFSSKSVEANFTVEKDDPIMSIEVQNIIYGGVEHIRVHVNAEGDVTIKVIGTGIVETISLENGEKDIILRADSSDSYEGNATLNIYNLRGGKYPVEVTYNGNGNYNKLTASTEFEVYKAETSMSIEAEPYIDAGEDQTINITLSSVKATGWVYVYLAGRVSPRPVFDGFANYTTPLLESGKYQYVIIYEGDENFKPYIARGTFEVGDAPSRKDISIGLDVVPYLHAGETQVINITMSDSNATGRVTIILDNNNYTRILDNGSANFTTPVLPGSNYTVVVIYEGDYMFSSNWTYTAFAVEAVQPDESPLDVRVDNISVGDTAIIIVELPKNATGNVTVSIDGVSHTTSNITDGIARFEIENLTAGIKTISVDYTGDGNYIENHTTANITVTKANPEIKVNVVVDGDNAFIYVTTPKDATNSVLVDVDGEGYYANITDGKGQLVIPGLTGGSHVAIVKYPGDDRYTPSEPQSKSFNVSNVPSGVSVKVDNITYGDKAVIEITVPADATGNVTVTIGGKDYSENVSCARAILIVTGLDAGNYTVNVTYNGDEKYASCSNFTNLEVSKANAAINVIDNGNNGKSTESVKVSAKKTTPKITAKKKTFKAKTKTKKYTITLKDNTGKPIKKAKVTLKVKGKTYKAKTNSKGKATFKIKNLNKKGTFKAVIKYKGNKYYNKVTKKSKIKVIVTFKTVSKGSKDKSTVKDLQQALKDHGYYLTYKGQYLKIDGIYHGFTERSVKEFQHDKGLKVTGKVDEKTAKKLGIL